MYIERNITNYFKKLSAIYSIIAIVGARQSGKTTFLKEQIKNTNSSYIMFDDPDVRELFEDIKKFENQYIEGYEQVVLDEVQYCKDSGQKLKYLADKNKKIWLTSSSEIILSKEVLSYLVGRVSILKIFPFSLREFLAARDIKEITTNILERAVSEHLLYGGYPKVVLTEDIELKKVILKDLYETMILKDIARTFSVQDIQSLEDFTRYISVNIGNILSYETVSRDIKLSFQTLKKYLDAMEKSYLIVRVPPFFSNKTKEITKQPKVYFLDTGLRNIISKSFDTAPEGKLFENYVLTELIKANFTPKYWRTKSKAEVDFIIETNKETVPIEVKINSESQKIERSLRSFIEAYKPKTALVVFYKGKESEYKVGSCKVSFIDVSKMREILSQHFSSP